MYFKAMFTNGKNVYFDAKTADSGITLGNRKASSKGLTMIAISLISEKEAIENNYEKTPVKKARITKKKTVKKPKAKNTKKKSTKKTKVIS